jgi:hypothetical protein
MDIGMTDFDKLKQAAKMAQIDPNDLSRVAENALGYVRFQKYATPAAILALIERLEKAEAEVLSLETQISEEKHL